WVAGPLGGLSRVTSSCPCHRLFHRPCLFPPVLGLCRRRFFWASASCSSPWLSGTAGAIPWPPFPCAPAPDAAAPLSDPPPCHHRLPQHFSLQRSRPAQGGKSRQQWQDVSANTPLDHPWGECNDRRIALLSPANQ